MTQNKILRGCLPACVAILLDIGSVKAAENGGSSYLPGFYGDFGMAITPGPGNYVNNFFGYNTAGNDAAGSNLLFELPGLIRITDTKIIGGNYWFGFFPYVLHTESSNARPDGSINRDARGGAGDMYALPLAITWRWEEFSLLAFEGIVLPTGSYEKNRSLNAGRNYWTMDTNVSMTWLPKNTSWDFSVTLGYMVNTENPATQYRTGDELHFDYLVGYYFLPHFGAGVTGSYYKQITADTGNGVPAGLALAEYSSIGPALMYNIKIAEKEVSFSAKWLHEFDVNNHIAGDYAILRTVFQF